MSNGRKNRNLLTRTTSSPRHKYVRTKEFNGTLWYTIVHNGTLWYTMVCDDTLWYTMVHNGTLWYAMIHYGTQWYTMVHDGTRWYTMVHDGIHVDIRWHAIGFTQYYITVNNYISIPQDRHHRAVSCSHIYHSNGSTFRLYNIYIYIYL